MIRTLVLAAVAVGALTAVPVAHAQHIHFEFGHGHHHGHHHHHCWDDWWCGPHYGYSYVYPPPVRERIVYVQPQPDLATPRTSSVPKVQLPTEDTRFTIRNGAGHKTPVNFLVDRQEASLSDGETRTWAGPARRSVQFDRGGSYGTAQYDLTAGEYEFIVTAGGWDLVRQDSTASRTATQPRKNTLPSGTTQR